MSTTSTRAVTLTVTTIALLSTQTGCSLIRTGAKNPAVWSAGAAVIAAGISLNGQVQANERNQFNDEILVSLNVPFKDGTVRIYNMYVNCRKINLPEIVQRNYNILGQLDTTGQNIIAQYAYNSSVAVCQNKLNKG
jgi:hypothetical protein